MHAPPPPCMCFPCHPLSLPALGLQEANAANIPIMAHAYTARAINRALQCGVSSIEHGNLMDESSVTLFRSTGAFYVPTLSTYKALVEEGTQQGLPADCYDKIFAVLDAGIRALEMAHKGGVKICFGIAPTSGYFAAGPVRTAALRRCPTPTGEGA